MWTCTWTQKGENCSGREVCHEKWYPYVQRLPPLEISFRAARDALARSSHPCLSWMRTCGSSSAADSRPIRWSSIHITLPCVHIRKAKMKRIIQWDHYHYYQERAPLNFISLAPLPPSINYHHSSPDTCPPIHVWVWHFWFLWNDHFVHIILIGIFFWDRYKWREKGRGSFIKRAKRNNNEKKRKEKQRRVMCLVKEEN